MRAAALLDAEGKSPALEWSAVNYRDDLRTNNSERPKHRSAQKPATGK
jgi:hypothetical protein